MRETSGMFTVAAPVVGSPVPLASNFTTLMTQLAFDGTAGLWIARGGPKKQFSTGWHAPAVPPQFASVVQLGSGLGPVQVPPVPQFALTKHVAPGVGPPTQVPALMQWLAVALDPSVQSSLPVPMLATSVLPGPTSR